MATKQEKGQAEANIRPGLRIFSGRTYPEVINGLKALYDMSEAEASSHCRLVSKREDIYKYVREATKSLFKEQDIFSNVNALEHAMKAYDQWVKEIIDSPTVAVVLSSPKSIDEVTKLFAPALDSKIDRERKSFTDREIETFARGLAATDEIMLYWKEHANDITTMPSYFSLLDATCELNKVATDYDQFKHIKRLLEFVRDLEAKNQKAVRTFVSDFGKALLYQYSDSGWEGYKNISYRLAISDSNVTKRTVEMFDIDPYTRLSDNAYIRVLEQLPDDILQRGQQITLVIGSVRKLQDAGANMQIVETLLGIERAERRTELLEVLSNNPAAVELSERLRKVGVTRKDYNEFLISTAEIRIGDGRIFDMVLELSSKKYYDNAKLLIARGAELMLSGDHALVSQIVSSCETGHIPLKDYLRYKAEGSENKCMLALDLGQLKFDAAELKRLRGRLSSIQEGSIDWIAHASNSRSRINALDVHRERSNIKEDIRDEFTSHWYALLRNALHARQGSEKDVAALEAAYAKLPEGLTRRIRETWLNQPDALQLVCSDIIELGGKNGYLALLKNGNLFRAYLEKRITDPKAAGMIREAVDSPNPYNALREWLLPKKLEAKKISEPEKIVEATNGNRYKRAWVFAGIYGPKERDFLSAYARIPVSVYDQEELERNPDMSVIRSGDLVIHIISHSGHDTFERVKVRCEVLGIKVHPFRHQNVMLILNEIHRLNSSGAGIALRAEAAGADR